MAKRPIFIPRIDGSIGVEVKLISFSWYPGFSAVQKQKSIHSLHESAYSEGVEAILEISSKSEDELGVNLSAFNLYITTKKYNNKFSVESAFQSSKVFENGGPYKDLLGKSSRDAKKDLRLRNSGKLSKFSFFGEDFPLEPKTVFYDWLYINALLQNKDLAAELPKFQAFTDIEFNPDRSINCQAYSAALYVSFFFAQVDESVLAKPDRFQEIANSSYSHNRFDDDQQMPLM